ncbi:14707_t:CDS:2 [Racocetra fulgida]|uniref:14707_t:CDS:1 n=1 Tax=Racocetra fulgida TaxID=60492 RepID=A0A9N9APJ2_9GLOM|nr:14707_t:CDS:2 [Racocetra fulgida]
MNKTILISISMKKNIRIVKPLGDQIKRIHTDGFIVAEKIKLKTGIKILYSKKLYISYMKTVISKNSKFDYK